MKEVKSYDVDGNSEIDNGLEMSRVKQLSLAGLIQGDFGGHFTSIPELASRVFSDSIYEMQKCSLLGYLNVHGDMVTFILYGSNINRNTVPVLIPED